jgi:hypothetical protein
VYIIAIINGFKKEYFRDLPDGFLLKVCEHEYINIPPPPPPPAIIEYRKGLNCNDAQFFRNNFNFIFAVTKSGKTFS